MNLNAGAIYVAANGRLTMEGLLYFQGLERRIAELEARLTGPEVTGGATVDAEARAAINAIRGQA
jgi:hypothetical protein